MTAFEILRNLKSKIELDAQVADSDVVVTEITGNKTHSRAVVMREIEGRLTMVEVTAKVLGEPITTKLRLLPSA